jgi:hypothetical protein
MVSDLDGISSLLELKKTNSYYTSHEQSIVQKIWLINFCFNLYNIESFYAIFF